jgi:hypothetical protein
MQTSVRTTVVEEDDSKRLSSAKTVTHDHADVISRKMTGVDPEEDENGIDIDELNGGHVLDITTTPPAIIGVQFNQDGDRVSCSGLSLLNHSYVSVGLLCRGAITSSHRISGFDPVDDSNYGAGTIVSLAQEIRAKAFIDGDNRAGYFNVNGEYLYIELGSYSMQKVYLDNCGVLDANGDRYIYDDQYLNMIEMEEITKDGAGTGEYYGQYSLCDGNVVADTLQRCINDMFNETVVDVVYTDSHFIIFSDNDLVTRIAVPNDAYGASYVLGINGKTSSPLGDYDFDGKNIYLDETHISDVNSEIDEVGRVVTSIPYSSDMDYGTMYVLDPLTEVTVKVFNG